MVPSLFTLIPVLALFTLGSMSASSQEEQHNSRVLWIVVVLLLVLGWLWWLGRRREEMAPEEGVVVPPSQEAATESIAQSAPLESGVAEAVEETPAAEEAPAEEVKAVVSEVLEETPSQPDDLKVIEGIGPKIERLLHDAGILTYAQLASTDVERLREILTEAKLINIADPTTWPEQAALAAAGKWEELKALQGTLKGGRRVS